METSEVIAKALSLAKSQQNNWKNVKPGPGVTENWMLTPNGSPCQKCGLPVFRGVYGYAGDVCKCDFQRSSRIEELEQENERLRQLLIKQGEV